MANLRNLKKEIDYRLEEVVFDCDMAICFQPSKEKEIFAVMQEAVAVRNDLFAKAMNPAEPHNASLVRKHYAALRAEMDDVFGKLFEKLSQINGALRERYKRITPQGGILRPNAPGCMTIVAVVVIGQNRGRSIRPPGGAPARCGECGRAKRAG